MSEFEEAIEEATQPDLPITELVCEDCGVDVSGPNADSVRATMDRHRLTHAAPAAEPDDSRVKALEDQVAKLLAAAPVSTETPAPAKPPRASRAKGAEAKS